MKKSIRTVVVLIVAFAVTFLAVSYFGVGKDEKNPTYLQIIQQINNGEVEKAVLDDSNGKLTYYLKSEPDKKLTYNVSIYRIEHFLEKIDPALESEAVNFDIKAPTVYPAWVSSIPMILLLVGVGVFAFIMMNQMNGGGKNGAMAFGRSRAKLITDDKKRITFDDVAGADEEKEELSEIVEFLKNPRRFVELGARIPKGVLLVGAPGTGKTLFAKAIAGEAKVPFFSISGSDFVELYVGVGASRVRDLFEQAKKNTPCIVFIDEIDAVGRQRGAGLGGGHDEREQTLNQLLVEMDGFGVNEGVIIIAATNRPDVLDSALLRPGRFDRQIVINVPDIKGREAILKVHSKGKPLADEVNLDTIAKETVGFTGAELENVLNEAALYAARRKKKKIDMHDIEDAIMKVCVGVEKKSRVVSEKERKLTAFHEAGHAIVTRCMTMLDPVHQISIVPRGRAGGYTLSLPMEDKSYMSRTEMIEEINSLLGGRVAEKIALDDISTGASNDLERATAIAKKMVTKFGMSDALGPVVYGSEHEEVFLGRDFTTQRNFSEETASAIDREVKRIIEESFNIAKKCLEDNFDKLTTVANALLEREKLSGEEFEALMNGKELPALEAKEEPNTDAAPVNENEADTAPAAEAEAPKSDEKPIIKD
ncbi:MAG: ATP-dependent zinc metalloprotease FtsH [Clostridia bacterium]|nr:ATP-dependent zinc metalloprotease FtsH [Clostridia bacterium]